MITLSRFTDDDGAESSTALTGAVAVSPECFALTLFTLNYREVRDFYVDVLGARVRGEKQSRVCEFELGGIPFCLRQAEQGEMISYFHIYLTLKNLDPLLGELRRRGVIVTSVGPYTNFRDPEGRVIKLAQRPMSVV